MAAPQNEQEYIDLLRQREQALTRIKAVQAELDAMGFMPADQQQHNRLLAERVRILDQQKRAEQAIAQADPSISRPFEVRRLVQEQMQASRQRQQALTEQLRLQRDIRTEELRQQFGSRLGGAMGRFEQLSQSRFARMAGAGLTAFGATAGSMAQQGFVGTVESARLSYEMTLLAREFAAAFKPIIELMTAGAKYLRTFMQGLDESGQNLVMVAGLLGGAYGLSRFGGRLLGAAGGMLGMGGGMLGGAAGMMAGGVAGGAAAAGGGGASGVLALPGASSRAAAGASRMARLGRVAKIGGVAAIAAGVYAATPSTPTTSEEFAMRHPENAERLERLQRDGGVEALQAELTRLRANRTSGQKFYSAVGSIFGAPGQERDTIEQLERTLIAQGVNPKTFRRSVTPNNFGYEDFESVYKRASVSAFPMMDMPGEGSKPSTNIDMKPAGVSAEQAIMTPVVSALNTISSYVLDILNFAKPKEEVR